MFVFLCTSSKIAISFGIVVLNPQHWKTIISLFKPSKYILNVVERPSNLKSLACHWKALSASVCIQQPSACFTVPSQSCFITELRNCNRDPYDIKCMTIQHRLSSLCDYCTDEKKKKRIRFRIRNRNSTKKKQYVLKNLTICKKI